MPSKTGRFVRGGEWTSSLITAVAVGITVVAVTAVAQSPVEPTQIVAQQTLTNRSESPFSEIDFRLGDHQHLKGYFLDNSRDRLLR